MLNLRSTTRRRLLAYYFTNPAARHHVRDLAARLRVDPSNLSKELIRLENEGLFQSEVNGRQKYYSINASFPLLREVRRLVTKTIGAVPLIAASLRRIQGVESAVLYGSFARNQHGPRSDIDVLVIGCPKSAELAEAARELERQLGREVNYSVLTRKEFQSRRAHGDSFLRDVWQNKRIVLVGSDAEIENPHR